MDTPFHLLVDSAKIGTKKLTSMVQSGPGYHFITLSPDGQVLRKAIQVLDQEGQAYPVIDSVNDLSLASVLAAFDKSESGRAKGKIVIRVL